VGPRRRGWCLTHKQPLHDERGRVIGMAGFSKDLPQPDSRSAVYRQVARAVEHLRARHAEPLRIRDVARQAGLTPRRLERLVRRVFHLTPGQLLVQARIDSALRLLAEGGASIADIAQACGYSDHSAFTRQFRATVGMTPREFRRSAAPREAARP
jgi:AraC-like DNA-binding protein